jgi:hypothetical protein
MKKIALYYIFFMTICFTLCKAQTDTAYIPKYSKDVMYEIITNTDLKYRGYIVEEKSYGISIKNPRTNVKTYLYNSEIHSIVAITNVNRSKKKLELFEENEHTDYYMLGSSAFLFEKETITTTYHWGALENISFPISENWAVTASTLFFYPYSLGVKCAFKLSENSYLGGNVFGMGNVLSQKQDEYFWGYGAKVHYTQGTSNNNFTVSGGVLGLNSKLFTNTTNQALFNLYFLNFSYCNRFSRLFALNAEAWYFPESQSGFGGLGLKLVNDKYYSWTFGCYTALNNFNNSFKINVKTIPIPYIGYSQKF